MLVYVSAAEVEKKLKQPLEICTVIEIYRQNTLDKVQ